MATDVAIVGGGVVGAACALELTRRGVEVALFERAELASAASGRNHGLVVAPSEPLLAPMASATLEAYRALAEESAVPFGLDHDPIGYVIVAADDEERAQAMREVEASARFGISGRELDPAELRALEPEIASFSHAWVLDDGRRVDPGALTVAMALRARELGARIETHARVRSLVEREGAARGVVTDDGVAEAGAVVVAAGPWTSPFLRQARVRVPVVGARGWLVHLDPGRALVSRIVERAGWHLLPGEDALRSLSARDVVDATTDADVGTLLQPNADGSVLVGGSRQVPAVHEPEDHSVPREIVRRAIAVVPALADARVLGSWWGIRPMSPDGRPIIGRLGPGLLVATGHGSQGVILAGGTAELVASLVTGDPPPFDPAPYDPSRFAAQ